MNRKIWGSYSGVVVDRCSKHGTWYDESELAKVAEYIALGGVEYEKMKKPDQNLRTVEGELLQKIDKVQQQIDGRFKLALFCGQLGL